MIAIIQRFLAALVVVLFVGPSLLSSQDSTASQVPAQLVPPAGEKLVLQVHAKGAQIYVCKKTGDQFAWTLKGPQAELFDDQNKVIGHHFAGPTWESNDGSQVVGKVTAKVDSPDSIPWLLLSAASHSGNGILSKITSIQRLQTKDGKAPASGCDAGHENKESPVNYTAAYFFYAQP